MRRDWNKLRESYIRMAPSNITIENITDMMIGTMMDEIERPNGELTMQEHIDLERALKRSPLDDMMDEPIKGPYGKLSRQEYMELEMDVVPPNVQERSEMEDAYEILFGPEMNIVYVDGFPYPFSMNNGIPKILGNMTSKERRKALAKIENGDYENRQQGKKKTTKPNRIIISPSGPPNPTEFPIELYDQAYEIVNNKFPGVFAKGSTKGAFMTLLRIKPHPCHISGIIHEKENAYIGLTERMQVYRINYGCGRRCLKNGSKTISCGSIKKTDIKKI